MINKISVKIVDRWIKNGSVSEENALWCIFGLEAIISGLLSIFLVVLVGVFLKSTVEALLFLACFIPIRQYSGGFHADSHLKCTLSFLALFLFCLGASSLQMIVDGIWISLLAVSITLGNLCIYKLCPVENINKPLKKEDLPRFRNIALVIFNIENLLALIFLLAGIEYYKVIIVAMFAILILAIAGSFKEKKQTQRIIQFIFTEYIY